MIPFDEMITNPALHLCMLDAPFICMVYSGSGGGSVVGERCDVEAEAVDEPSLQGYNAVMNAEDVNSEMKSVIACALMVVHGWYVISNSPRSTDHLIN